MDLKPSKPTRSPRGVEKPVAMRLLPEEREELERIAADEVRSAASMARIIYLRGVSHYRAEASA
ncbi:hypothetical protein SAMN05661010_00051 [Modicisalibacter muralis]|uniref:Uncharacterized protein n=1 Tax=Modicisalibacter muralis TaxID=119000 RepID=A0A1G9ENT9_9GAMM|nr:hypothetical protein [Halomonas muralis]SDK77867.1 hypothetical protein SAMN05661010_00051 [Halomonas muralis]